MVEYSFRPEGPENAPWIWYDEFEPGVAGDTLANGEIKCSCAACEHENSKEGCFQISCKISLNQIIRIRRGRAGKRLTGTYGHEQRHVRNFIKVMKGFGEQLAEKKGKCMSKKACEGDVWFLNLWYKQMWEKERELEADHTRPIPRDMVPYPPIGKMPTITNLKDQDLKMVIST